MPLPLTVHAAVAALRAIVPSSILPPAPPNTHLAPRMGRRQSGVLNVGAASGASPTTSQLDTPSSAPAGSTAGTSTGTGGSQEPVSQQLSLSSVDGAMDEDTGAAPRRMRSNYRSRGPTPCALVPVPAVQSFALAVALRSLPSALHPPDLPPLVLRGILPAVGAALAAPTVAAALAAALAAATPTAGEASSDDEDTWSSSGLVHCASLRLGGRRSPLVAGDVIRAAVREEVEKVAVAHSSSFAAALAPRGRVLDVQVGSRQGKRSHMEDITCVVPSLSDLFGAATAATDGEEALVAIFDGHGGSAAAEYCADHLPWVLGGYLFGPRTAALQAFSPNSDTAGQADTTRTLPPADALMCAFVQLDADFALLADRLRCDAGTTALVAFVSGGTLYVATCGDCTAILCRGGVAVPIGAPHVSNSAREREAVESRGGSVAHMHGAWRVGGMLQVTRALGDRPCRSSLGAVPDVFAIDLTPEDSFVVLGSDGLFSAISPADAVRMVREARAELNGAVLYDGAPRSLLADALVDVALERGAVDNVSAALLFFRQRSS